MNIPCHIKGTSCMENVDILVHSSSIRVNTAVSVFI